MITNIWRRIKATFAQLNPTARILTSLLLALAIPNQLNAAGPAPVNLLSTSSFVILAGAAITTTGGGIINGNVGASPIAGSAIGVTCAQMNGTIYEVDASGPPCAVVNSTLLTQAKNDLTTAYNDAAGRTPVPSGPNLNPNGGNLGGLNLAPGLYKFTTTAYITGSDVTLTGGPNDVWIFQCAQDLQLGSGIHVILAGGAQANNIFWQVGTSAVLGTFSVFNGTILASQAITMNTSSTMNGRALAFTAGVTFNGNGANVPVNIFPVIVVQQPLGTNLVNGDTTNSFGSVNVGANTNLTFTITNTGSANLTGLSVTIDGLNSPMFTVTTNPAASVNPGDATTFTVRFAPVSAGIQTATLHIASNDTNNNPFNLALTGTGAGLASVPGIVVQQPLGSNLVNDVTPVNFGPVGVGASNNLTFTITNIGAANLTGLGITIDGANSSQFIVTANPTAPVIPDGSTTFTVLFTPAGMGVMTAVLHIANNDVNNNPFNIPLTGTGISLAPEIIVQQPSGTNLVNDVGTNSFGFVGDSTNASLTFTIINSGAANLTGLGITIDGTGAAFFSVTANPAAPLISGGSTTFTVSFAPVAIGIQNALLHIASNDTNNNPFNIALAGTGISPGIIALTDVLVNINPPGASPITLDPQTGLFTNSVLLTNAGPNNIPALQLYIVGLPPDVQVYNASGSGTNGIPYVQYNFPLAPGATVVFWIEYYRPSRQAIPPLIYVPQVTTPVTQSVVNNGIGITIDKQMLLPNGQFLIGFYASPGKSYAVQYSADMITWLTANPFIVAPANYVQWIDEGPPKTQTPTNTRYYRAFKLP